MNVSAVHLPRPVSGSGVRFAVKLTPQGPAQAVIVFDATAPHGPSGARAGPPVIATSCGWPESMRVMSGSGPRGVIVHGVWQSLHTMIFTRYSPRATWGLVAAARSVMAGAGDGTADSARAATPMPPSAARVSDFLGFMAPPSPGLGFAPPAIRSPANGRSEPASRKPRS